MRPANRRSLALAALLALLLLLLLPAPPARAGDDFLPDQPDGFVTWSEAPLYDRYPVWHYTYGARLAGQADTVYRLTYAINLLQVGKAWLVKFAVRSLEYALHLDLITPLLSKAASAMAAVGKWLWEKDGAPLVVAGLIATGAMALVTGALGGRRSRGLRMLGGAAAVLVVGYGVLAVGPSALSAGARVSREVGAQIVGAAGLAAAPAGSQGNAAERLVRAAGESAWRTFVLQPWVEGEFTAGSATKPAYMEGTVAGGKWLALSPVQRTQQYNINLSAQLQDFHQWDAALTLDYLPRRATLAGVSFVLGSVYAGGVLLLTGSVLYYQLLLLVILVLAPLWLVLALWHPSGLRIVKGALVKAVGALVAQVVLMTVIAAHLALSLPLASFAEAMGWMVQGLCLAVLAAMLFRYRFRWLRWSREEEGREREAPAAPWLRQVLPWRRESAGRLATARAEAAAAAALAEQPLPRFREERSEGAPALAERQPPEVPASVALAGEMRRLRMVLHRPAGGDLPGRDELGLKPGAAAMGGGQAAAEPGGSGRRVDPVRPEVGQVLNRFRKR